MADHLEPAKDATEPDEELENHQRNLRASRLAPHFC
jgi:hypothetical protein